MEVAKKIAELKGHARVNEASEFKESISQLALETIDTLINFKKNRIEKSISEIERSIKHQIHFIQEILAEVNYEALEKLAAIDPLKFQILLVALYQHSYKKNAIIKQQQLISLQKSIDSLDINNAAHKPLKQELIELKRKLQKLKAPHSFIVNWHLFHSDQNIAFDEQIKFAEACSLVTEKLVSDTSKADKINTVAHFEDSIGGLSFLKNPRWQQFAKTAVRIIFAGVGAALGVGIGAALMAICTAPVGGVGAIYGAVHGGIMGAALGIFLSGSLFGLGYAGASLTEAVTTIGLFKLDKTEHTKQAARKLLKSYANPTPSLRVGG